MRKKEITKAKEQRIRKVGLGRVRNTSNMGRPAKRAGTKARQAQRKREELAALDSPAIAISGTAPLWACPEWFDENERAQWQYGIDNFPKGILSAPDRELLIIWCQASVLHAKASQMIRREGAVLYSRKKGMTFPNPWVAIQEKQAHIMLKTGNEMGGSPLARAHIARLVLLKLDQEQLVNLANRNPGAVDADYQTIDTFAANQPSEQLEDEARPDD